MSAGYSTRRSPVLRELSLSLEPRGTTRLSGANGTGKSTLVEVASGYLPVWSGQVLVGGTDAASPLARPLRRTCRTSPALYASLTVHEHLALAATARSVALGPVLARAEQYGLSCWFDREARELSTGNARKLWFVLCTVGEFSIAMLDEPFNGLDDIGRALMCGEIADWSHDRAVVVVAHERPVDLLVDHEVRLELAA